MGPVLLQESMYCMCRNFRRQRASVTGHSAFLEFWTPCLCCKSTGRLQCCYWFEDLNCLVCFLCLFSQISSILFFFFSFRIGRQNASLIMSLFLKDYCWFPISYGIKHKLILALSLQTNSRFFSVLSCHLSLALLPTSFDTPALSLPCALIHATPSGLYCHPSLLKPYSSLKVQCENQSLCRNLPDSQFRIKHSFLELFVNNMVKSPLIV